MTPTHEPSEPRSKVAEDRGVVWHPAWCDLARCTADPASQAGGYRPGAGGEHQSVPVQFDLSTGAGLSVPDVRDGTGRLTQACAPWPCETYLRVQVGQMRQERLHRLNRQPIRPDHGERHRTGLHRPKPLHPKRHPPTPVKDTHRPNVHNGHSALWNLTTQTSKTARVELRIMASAHDQSGWKSFAFPISVDGLEIVSSLCVVVQRRAGRPVGWIPWIALVIGTLASLAANIGVGDTDLIGKALAGWPALSMLVSVKLLFSMFDHAGSGDQPAVPDDQRPSALVPAVPGPSRPNRPEGLAPSGTAPIQQADEHAPSTAGETAPDSRPPGRRTDRSDTPPVDLRSVSHLIPAARAAHATLTDARRSVSRDALATAMRRDGHSVSNAHASTLLKILKAEADTTPFAATPTRNRTPARAVNASAQHRTPTA